MKFSLTSPSKLNLRLEVVGRRHDEFHLLKMLNVETTLADHIELEVARGNPSESKVSVNFRIPGGHHEIEPWQYDISKNLAGKIALAFLNQFKLNYKVSIDIQKSIPVGAGLGGGSSNAASVMNGLICAVGNEILEGKRISKDEFKKVCLEIASNIGSDIPYFLTGGLSIVEGVGEKVTPITIPSLEEMSAYIITPSVSISTAELFGRFRSSVPHIPTKVSVAFDTAMSISDIKFLVHNDLEQSVVSLLPVVGEILSRLRAKRECVSVTGSGSACFVLSPSLSLSETESLLSNLRASAHKVTLKAEHKISPLTC